MPICTWGRGNRLSFRMTHCPSIPIMCYVGCVILMTSLLRDALNYNQFNLNFMVDNDLSKVTFLDLQIFKGSDNFLATSLCHKETASNTLLHAASAHSPSLIQSIPYAQYIGLRRNCPHLSDFKTQAQLLRSRLLFRGYSKSLLRYTRL